MHSPSSPAGRGRHPAAPAAGGAAGAISPDTRQEAQEADAGMARDEWKYTPASLKSTASAAAKITCFLP